MTGVARFDCYPSDLLNGLIGLTADQIAVYTIVLLLQYDRGEPVLLEGRERELAIRAGLTRGRLMKAIDDLVRLGKLKAAGGRVWNSRAEQELAKIRERIEKNRENSEKGGNATRQKFEEKSNENKDDIGPSGQPTGRPSGRPYSPPPLPLPLEDISVPSEPRPKQVRTAYSADFDQFWSQCASWRGNSGKSEAHAEWRKLSAQDRTSAERAAPLYAASLASDPTSKALHVCRFLKYRRYEIYAEGVTTTTQNVAHLGSRLAEDWKPGDETREWTLDQVAQDVAGRELLKFRDYYRSRPGAAGMSLDWDAAWRNWVRNAADKKAREGPPRDPGWTMTA